LTAVSDIIAAGIPKEMIVVGKPVLKTDADNTGWVDPSELGTWAK